MSLVAGAVARTERAVRRARERRNYPVAIHLAFFAIGTLIPVLLIVAWMLIHTSQLWRDDSLRDANAVVRHLNATIEVEIEKAVAVAQTLATSPAFDKGDYAALDGQARDVASKLGVVIAARDRSGRQIVNTAAPAGSPLWISNESVLAIDRLAAAREAPVISDLVTDTVPKAPLVIADIPVVKGSEAVAFIDVELYPRRIAEILTRELPDGWISGVIGGDGRLIAGSADQDRYLGTSNRPFLDAATAAEGVWTGKTREGEAIAGVYIRSPLSGWLVYVAVPETILRAPARSAMLWLGGVVIVSLAVSGYLGWRLSRRISAPIRALVYQARELGEGRGPAASHSSVREVNDVTEALLAASVELDRRAAAASQTAEAVRANEERLQLVQDTAGIGTVDWDVEADRAVCSPQCYEMLALPTGSPTGIASFIARVRPLERDRLERSWKLLLGAGGPFEEEFRILTPNGEERWIYARGRLDMKDGRPVRLLGAGIDITGRKRSEEHLRFLLREISHRSKNLLAVIQAMASQTAKSVETVDDFKRRFGERLMGLAASHDLLVNQNWLGASVENLVRGQLSPFIDGQDPRVRIHGPAVDLKAEAAEALGLALHELATNSLKFGGLSGPAGKVEITWDVYEPGDAEPGDAKPVASGGTGDRDFGPDRRRFRMDWIEHTASPVSPPNHKGFGRRVIEHTVETTLRGRVTLAFPPEGVRWRIDAPASCLAPLGQGVAA